MVRRHKAKQPASWMAFPRLPLTLLVLDGLLFLSGRLGLLPKGYAVLIAVALVGGTVLLFAGRLAAGILFRWRFQYSIRLLLALPLVVAVPFSWLAVEARHARTQRELVAEITKFGGRVGYDWEWEANQRGVRLTQPPARPLGLMGGDFFADVAGVRVKDAKVTEALLRDIGQLSHLKGLALENVGLTGPMLEQIKGLTKLRRLILDHNDIADSALESIREMKELEWLLLDNTSVTGPGLEYITGLSKLDLLQLNDSKVTDAGLKHIGALTNLHDLQLDNTMITDAGLERLKNLKHLNLSAY